MTAAYAESAASVNDCTRLSMKEEGRYMTSPPRTSVQMFANVGRDDGIC